MHRLGNIFFSRIFSDNFLYIFIDRAVVAVDGQASRVKVEECERVDLLDQLKKEQESSDRCLDPLKSNNALVESAPKETD